MFEPLDNAGKPLTAEYAKLRSHFERLIEMMQIKGNSEVHRSFWPADEFADFENGDSVATFSGRTFKKENFVRWAVTKGLDYEAKLGANPYQLGFIGGTDNHNGAPGGRRRGQLHRQPRSGGRHAEGPPRGRDRRLDQGQGVEPGVAVRGLGLEEHPRGHLGRHGRA